MGKNPTKMQILNSVSLQNDLYSTLEKILELKEFWTLFWIWNLIFKKTRKNLITIQSKSINQSIGRQQNHQMNQSIIKRQHARCKLTLQNSHLTANKWKTDKKKTSIRKPFPRVWTRPARWSCVHGVCGPRQSRRATRPPPRRSGWRWRIQSPETGLHRVPWWPLPPRVRTVQRGPVDRPHWWPPSGRPRRSGCALRSLFGCRRGLAGDAATVEQLGRSAVHAPTRQFDVGRKSGGRGRRRRAPCPGQRRPPAWRHASIRRSGSLSWTGRVDGQRCSTLRC